MIQPQAVEALPLRIGILMDHPSPHMAALLDALAEKADAIAQVLYLGKTAPGRHWGAPAGSLPYRFLRGIPIPSVGGRVNPELIRALKNTPVDVWVVNTIYTSPSTWLASWWLGRGSTPWVYMNEPPRPRNRILAAGKSLGLGFVLRKAWGVIGMGEKATAKFRSLVADHLPAVSVPYYIDLGPFVRLPEVQPPGKGQALEFLLSCRLVPGKGMEVLLQACRHLTDMNWRLTLVGDGPLRRSLEEQFRRFFPPERVVFRGEVPYATRHEAFAGHHVFVFPSRWDGWGMVVPEALAAGLPVIATDQVMAAHEFIRDGVNGFIIPANQAQALAEKMAYFVNHPENLPSFSSAARKALQDYRPEVGAQRLVNFLRCLVREQEPASIPENGLTGNPPPTWYNLTTPKSLLARMKRHLRREAKKRWIQSHNMIRVRKTPIGHRILVYHLVLPEDRKRFEEQIRFLRDHFRICPVSNLLESVKGENGRGGFYASITLDDGFRILMDDCLEILERNGIKASFFVPTGFIELSERAEIAARFSRRAHYYEIPLQPMGPEDLKTLTKLGHEIGSHGVSHTRMSFLSKQQAMKELTGSRQKIAQWTGISPSGFSYPHGQSQNPLGTPAFWIREAGYHWGFTLKRGAVMAESDPYSLPREHVEGNWSVKELRYFLFK